MNTHKKAVCITGCSTGFGRALVTDFLNAGYFVIATLRQASTRTHLFQIEQEQFKDQLLVLDFDVTQSAQCLALTQKLESLLPNGLDVLINNAGYGLFGALEDLTEPQLRDQFEVNFFGTALTIQSLLPLIRRAKGRIINLSSVFGFTGFPLTSAYCASKFAIEGLSESLRTELKPFQVQVAWVEPGGHRTQFSNSVQWGKRSFEDHSPYVDATRGYAQFKNQLSQKSNPATANQVSQSILKLSQKKRMPARLVCGNDAKGMSWLRQPRLRLWIAERVNDIILRLWIRSGKKKGNLL